MTGKPRGANGRFISTKPPKPRSKDPIKDFISLIKAHPEQIERAVNSLFKQAAKGNLRAIDMVLKYGLEDDDQEKLTPEVLDTLSDDELCAITRGEDWRNFVK